MEFSRQQLQLLAVALDYRIQFLRLTTTKENSDLVIENLMVLRKIENHLTETAYPATPALNRDATNEIWA